MELRGHEHSCDDKLVLPEKSFVPGHVFSYYILHLLVLQPLSAVELGFNLM